VTRSSRPLRVLFWTLIVLALAGLASAFPWTDAPHPACAAPSSFPCAFARTLDFAVLKGIVPALALGAALVALARRAQERRPRGGLPWGAAALLLGVLLGVLAAAFGRERALCRLMGCGSVLIEPADAMIPAAFVLGVAGLLTIAICVRAPREGPARR